MNEQVERGKDIHMISCLVNEQIERCKYVHRMFCFMHGQEEKCKNVHRMALFGELTSRQRQRCSYDGAVW